ncbi:MAG: phytanoyl-CoA dioxygenase family protein [Actinomycetota bacterium]
MAEIYRRDGVLGAVPILSEAEATAYREQMERDEATLGASFHYRDKAHTALPYALRLATHPTVLDLVEELMGPDILLYNATFIIKEAGTTTKVSWHQDLTYWGLEDDDGQVSMWLALSPATEASGCMRMIPGSHRRKGLDHVNVQGDDNLLLLGQELAEVDESGAELYPLAPGEASFHHGWTVHTSAPNRSDDRRIGLNVQYLTPNNRVVAGSRASGLLVRGRDDYGHYDPDPPPPAVFDDEAIAAWDEQWALMKANFLSGQS